MRARAKAEPGTINVLILEPDPKRQERLITCLSGEASFRVVGAGEDFLYICQIPILRQTPVDVLLANLDPPEMAGPAIWAAIHFLLKGTRIVALTEGNDTHALEAALAAGVTALHRLDAEPDVLRRTVRNAAQGVVDYDPWLIERVKPVLLRPSEEMQIHMGELTIDLQMQEVARRGELIHLTPLEFEVLAYLARNRGRPVSSAELLKAVWQTSLGKGGTTAQVKNCIKRLRQKIEPDAKHPRYLQPRRGWGYILRDPFEQPPD